MSGAPSAGAASPAWPEGVRRVLATLQQQGHPHAPILLDAAARTAQQAADALGIALGQIAKSIIFRRQSDDVAVLVVTSGDRRVDEHKVAALVGPLGRADASYVKARTGFSIGGVPPLAHLHAPVTLLDRELFRFEEIWAAAGHPHSVFRLSPQQLAQLSGAATADVVQAQPTPPAPVSPAPPPQAATPAELLAARALQVPASGDAVPSPCISVCRMNATTGCCDGCWRTLAEIGDWSRSDGANKRAVWDRIKQRLAAQAEQTP